MQLNLTKKFEMDIFAFINSIINLGINYDFLNLSRVHDITHRSASER